MRDAFRRWIWRLGRKLYCWARGDLANDPNRNGEYWLVRHSIEGSASGGVILDVGANVGAWSLHALSLADAANKQVKVFAFEPCSATREILQRRISATANIEISAFALSSVEGEADFFSNGAGAGTNSLNAVSGGQSERVRLTTLDKFLDEHCIDRVAMLKIDTEGFDLDVVRGAAHALAEGRIDLVQFEYNWRWLLNNASLLQVFNLIADKPYRFGKLVGSSIVFYGQWHFELDRYFENNYVLVLKGSQIESLGKIVQFDESNCPMLIQH